MPRDFFETTIGKADPATGIYSVLSNVRISVYLRGTTTPVTIYQREPDSNVAQGPSPEAGAVGSTNPFTTGASGSVQFWCVAPGRYDVAIHDNVVPARIADRTIQWNAVAIDGIPETSLAQAILDAIVPIGGQLPYGGLGDPAGGRWLLCDGRTVLQADYPVLFSRTAHRYGADPGGGGFKLPDKRGRVSVGADDFGTARGAAGNLSSLTSPQRATGQKWGLDTHRLQAVEAGTASHGHGNTIGTQNCGSLNHAHAVSDPGHNHGFSPGTPVGNEIPGGGYKFAGGTLASQTWTYIQPAGTGIGIYSSLDTGYNLAHAHAMSGGVSDHAGAQAANPHNNLQPSEVDNWIIRVK
jgi:microcystin-dependent protein